MSRPLPIFLLIVAALMLAACSEEKETPEPTRRPTADVAYDAPTVSVPDYSDEAIAQGGEDYAVFCVPCHGPGLAGIMGLGPSLLDNEFVKTHTDEELLAFVIAGRPVDHPDNTTGVMMPSRGGFPNLQDEQILNIIAYIRTR